MADKLHDVGEKKAKKDDYDRRLEALASEFLPTLSPEDRGRFIGTVMEKDKGALGSWLQKDRLDKLVDNGRIDDSDCKRVLDGVSRRITRARLTPPINYVPTSSGFVEAAARGLGWCLAPQPLAEPYLRAGRIVLIDAQRHLDVPLYWQHAAVRSSVLQRIGQVLRETAADALRT